MTRPIVFALYFDGGWPDLALHAASVVLTMLSVWLYLWERRKRLAIQPIADVVAAYARGLPGVPTESRAGEGQP